MFISGVEMFDEHCKDSSGLRRVLPVVELYNEADKRVWLLKGKENLPAVGVGVKFMMMMMVVVVV